MKKRNAFIYLLVFILIIGTAFYYAYKNKETDGEDYISSKENAEDYILDKYNNGFITYNGSELIHYDPNMEQKWVLAIDEEGANLSVNDKYILISGTQSNKIYLVKDGKLIYESKIQKDLKSATVNEKGYVTALTSDKGYKGQCLIYDAKGNNLLEYSFGEKYILGAYLASDNKTLVLNTVEDGDVNYLCKVLFMDLQKGEIKNEITEDKVISYLRMYKDKVFIGTDDKISCFNKRGKLIWEHSFDKDSALYIGFDQNYAVMVLKTKENFGGNEVLTFSLSGRLKGRYVSDSQISAFDTSGGFSSVYVNDEILLLNKRGHVTGRVDADSNIRRIKLFKDANRVMVISNTAFMKRFGR